VATARYDAAVFLWGLASWLLFMTVTRQVFENGYEDSVKHYLEPIV
jgi:hypothetical protein